MNIKYACFPILVVAAIVAAVAWAASSPVGRAPHNVSPAPDDGFVAAVGRVDRFFQENWRAEQLTPANAAADLSVLRRLSLALHGTIPSLEEIREFEADDGERRLDRWTARMLADNRFADYFAERLARAFVGTDAGPFIIYRRDRFTGWLSDELKRNRPYDEIVRSLIAERGLWTGRPATNFITSAMADDKLDVNKLTGHSVRAFLGQRIDCAQCHDHPFAEWKQQEFEGLASFYGQAAVSIVGVEDDADKKYVIEDLTTEEKREVGPAVPFHPEWLPNEGNRRQRFAAWITHPDNRRFERAITNRVWGLLFGKPLFDPVDDLPHPESTDDPQLTALDILGADFREHGYDLRRLIHVITASAPFRLASVHTTSDEDEFDLLGENWAVFPLTRLRPEQIIGAMLQAASIKTIDRNSHLLVRTVRWFRENDFVRDYGDLGEDELQQRAGTIPQALLRMNGNLPNEAVSASPFNASGRIAGFSGSDEKCIETCFLVSLTRRPSDEALKHFRGELADHDGERDPLVEDILWSLFNSPEFSWNH